MKFLKWTMTLLSSLILLALTGCGGEDDATPANQAPGAFTVSVENISSETADLTWTASVDPDGDQISYSVILNGQSLATGVNATTVEVSDLTAETSYQGTVVASDGNGGETSSGFSFTTDVFAGIDDSECSNDNTINTTNIGCSIEPSKPSEYAESVAGDVRTIIANTYPNHSYSTRAANVTVEEFDRTYTIDATPSKAASTTSVLNEENRPRYYHGVGLNGIPFDPAPAEPFIFTDENTGEYNWDWVFEPTNNQTAVDLDCATAHVGPFGYHYHGDMIEYAEKLYQGISSGTVPTEPVQVGWASDGFPILYKYGPDASGNLKLLKPSYALKEGLRPGDGVTEPCGSYSGKYTEDYEYVEGLADLDECNGVERSISLTTASGSETFSYFYVITDDFPVMSRCMVGTPDATFTK